MKRDGGMSFSVPVTVVVLAIGFVFFSTVFIFIDRWFGLTSSPGLINAVLFTAVALMCVSNYAGSVFTDPGRAHPSTSPKSRARGPRSTRSSASGDAPDGCVGIKCLHWSVLHACFGTIGGGDLRYCQKCSLYKPPRAHHCRVCKRCVLRMDHHCIWINNCVGHANYKKFFVFVVYAVTACIYSLVLLFGSLVHDSQSEDDQIGDSSRTAYVISGLLLIPLSITLTILLGWHIYLILHNKTTIEYYEGVRAMWLAEKGGHIYKHPYDLGPYDNLTAVLGRNIFCWLCPTVKDIGSGLCFRTSFDNASGEI